MGECSGDSSCIETCRCPDGLVQEGEDCVDPEDCGCVFSFNGLYVKVGIDPGGLYSYAKKKQCLVVLHQQTLMCRADPDIFF